MQKKLACEQRHAHAQQEGNEDRNASQPRERGLMQMAILQRSGHPATGGGNSTHAPGQNERQKQREYEDTQVKRSQRRLRSKCQTFSQQHLFTRIAQQNIETEHTSG